MKVKLALQTLMLLPLWLVLSNFNTTETNTCPASGTGTGKSTYKIRKVVLDAGHGGKDPGCIGAASKEKDNALAIVLQVGKRIKAHYPEMDVIYTRDKDVFIELKERAAIANRNDADLFISVHCNSIPNKNVAGTETYVMGLHTAAHNLEVAKRENSAIYLEDNYQQNYEGYDPESPEAHILGSMWQSAYLEQSILLAGFVQQFAHSGAGRENRGVKQAGFLVLRETAMPAVLIEAGYLTNSTEEAYLASEEGQDAVGQAIFESFRAYKNQMEGHAEEVADSGKNKTAADQPIGPSVPKATPVKLPLEHSPAKNTAAKTTPKAYRILLLSWPSRLDVNTGRMALLSEIKEEKSGSEYRYFVGTFATRTEAEKMLGEIQNIGFKTAVIQPVD